ncbi:MAG TPA: UrcA family protein [Steroidobacteraceae bacterium]|nr:UrcA family protein [Steroidobacteraceae bacterium]
MTRFAPKISSRPRALTALAVAALTTAGWLGAPMVATAAQPAVDAPEVTVSYSARELASEQGTRALYRRIRTAAQSVCPGWDSHDLDEWAASRECQSQAVARAIGQIGNARLAALHAQTIARRG